MRKALIAVITASALFAVGAFAANIATVNSEDIASGSDAVTACADEVDVDFTTAYNDTSGDWDVTGADLTFYVNDTVTQLCDGYGATLVVSTSGLAEAAIGEDASIASGLATVGITPTLNAGDIVSASVLVDGEELQVASPGEGGV